MNEILVKKNVTVPETISWIRKAALAGTSHPEVQRITQICKESSNPLKTLFDIAYDTLVYFPDEENKQGIRTFDNMFRTGQGNCVSYTELISSVLLNLGIEHYYGVVGYESPRKWDHIYIQVGDKILDPVLGQAQNGTDTRATRPRSGKFNKETDYKFKKTYFMPDLVILQGERPYSGTRYASRTRRSRMKVAYGVQDIAQDHLGKTIVGKILSGVGDVIKGFANVAVTPFEAVFQTQIIGDNYSDTGFGDFIKKSQNVNSTLNSYIGTAVSTVFTGGQIKVVDIDKKTLQERAALTEQLTQNIANVQAQQEFEAQQAEAQAQFEALNEQTAEEAAAKSQRNRKIIFAMLAVAGLGTAGLVAYRMRENK
jgi:hypothetical protein